MMSSAETGGNVGAQGSACYFHWDQCSPSRSSKCAFGQAVSGQHTPPRPSPDHQRKPSLEPGSVGLANVKVSWGITLTLTITI